MDTAQLLCSYVNLLNISKSFEKIMRPINLSERNHLTAYRYEHSFPAFWTAFKKGLLRAVLVSALLGSAYSFLFT
jgi:hypothetical protein